jgi:hypothetical protein
MIFATDWSPLIAQVAVVLVPAIAAWFYWRTQILKMQAGIKEVKETGEANLTLSNGQMVQQKKLLVVSSKALAQATGDPVDVSLAQTAKKDLEEHLKTDALAKENKAATDAKP